MISYLEGTIISRSEKYIVIAAGGVGYKVFMPSGAPLKIPQAAHTVKMYTRLYLREDTMELYGFFDPAELELFEMLITVSGVGPKVALVIIATDKPSVLAGAIAAEDTTFLTKISGVGKKIAQKVIVDLKDKVSSLSFDIQKGDASLDADAIDALVALGWHMKDAREALKKVPKEITKTELRIKEALKKLGI
ncbi:Holliday junction branch migration protein RuvA [Candidatus Azambacteria bacterium]|nr:Holliday junction branch migration protein RuvA [Candidatus Azambacteria bacterium]